MKEISLAHGKGIALVDDVDYAAVSKYRWSFTHGYAHARVNGRMLEMHRFILGKSRGREIDHVNGNGLDNRRKNLRFATKAQNQQNAGPQANNTTGYKGVDFVQREHKYRAQIRVNGHRKHLGYFDHAIDAARAYDRAASEHFGEFAKLNIPEQT